MGALALAEAIHSSNMPKNQTPAHCTANTVSDVHKTAEFIAHPAATAARYACLSRALERELRESSDPFAAAAA
jgi:hypothetical protein